MVLGELLAEVQDGVQGGYRPGPLVCAPWIASKEGWKAQRYPTGRLLQTVKAFSGRFATPIRLGGRRRSAQGAPRR